MTTKTLKTKREKAGISARALSLRLGKCESYIAALESRHEEVPGDMVDAINAALAGDAPVAWVHANDEFDAARLSSLVDASEMTITQLAVAVGCARPQIYKWVKGDMRPNPSSSAALATALGVDESYLYGYGDDIGVVAPAKSEKVLVKMSTRTFEALRAAIEAVEGSAVGIIPL